MRWNEGLQGKALSIAQTSNNPLRVMAGPGTGKTFAMERRVARLLEEGNNPEKILAVTFSRTAAADLLSKLHNLKIEGCEKIKACTLHAFCLNILLKEDALTYTGRYPRGLIGKIPTFESLPLIQDLKLSKFGGKRESAKRIKAFEAAWARLQSEEPGWPTDSMDRAFHIFLIDWLKFHKGMLIGELIPLTLNYLKTNSQSASLNQYAHILVDEYQDLNKAEQSILELISTDKSFMIIGDEDQSIFSFRHAHPEGIKEFNNIHTATHDEELEECRRCPKKIVELANNLILNNHPMGTAHRLIAFASNPAGIVNIIQWKSMSEEITGVAAYVQHLIYNHSYEPQDFLILTPRKMIGYGIRSILASNKIATHSFYDEEALETLESQKSFCLLNMLVNKNDIVGLRYLLGFGSGTCNAGEYKKLRARCEEDGLTPSEILDKLISGKIELTGINNIVDNYKAFVARLDELEKLTITELIDNLFPEEKEEMKILRESCLLKLETYKQEQNKELEIKELLSYLKNIVTQPEMPMDGNFVRIMSLHKSKGLTCKVVIITGCVEGLIPFHDSKITISTEIARLMAEQRRLFYVAMTRPKEILIMSSFSEIEKKEAHSLYVKFVARGHSKVVRTITSRFIGELGATAPCSIRGEEWLKIELGK